MEPFSPQFFLLTLALVGVEIIVAALLSGFIDRSDIPQVGAFLALGAMLGPAGLQLLNVSLDSPILRVVATLSLVLVLFTDAVSLSIAEIRRHRLLAFLVVGPGTLLSAALIALAAWMLLDFSPASAVMIGAALASTDPVMLRGLLKRPGLPETVRLALRLESGLNDIVLLPVILVAMAVLSHSNLFGVESARLALELFLLGPGAGVTVGLLAIGALELVRRKTGVRRDYESLYSLGVAFAAYAAAEAVHGSGFLAAFCAGLTISALHLALCCALLNSTRQPHTPEWPPRRNAGLNRTAILHPSIAPAPHSPPALLFYPRLRAPSPFPPPPHSHPRARYNSPPIKLSAESPNSMC